MYKVLKRVCDESGRTRLGSLSLSLSMVSLHVIIRYSEHNLSTFLVFLIER